MYSEWMDTWRINPGVEIQWFDLNSSYCINNSCKNRGIIHVTSYVRGGTWCCYRSTIRVGEELAIVPFFFKVPGQTVKIAISDFFYPAARIKEACPPSDFLKKYDFYTQQFELGIMLKEMGIMLNNIFNISVFEHMQLNFENTIDLCWDYCTMHLLLLFSF